ncbi:MAG: amidohydrolase family protein, partial [Planctomycetes bacterium]|nr:amidohydrolase family protein [Planctomycetota bacterium]
MRTSTLFVLSLALLSAIDLPAQGRGRRGRRPAQPQQAPAPEPAAKKETKKEPKHYLAIVGGDVYIGTGQRLTGATVLVADDKIEKVGHDLDLPEGTEVIDAKGKCVSPGFVIVQGSGMGAGFSSPYKDSVNPFDPSIKQGLAAGITSFLVGSTSSRGRIGGSNAIIKPHYGDIDGMVLAEDTVCGIGVPLQRTQKEQLKTQLQQCRDYLKAIAEYPAQKAKDPKAQPPKKPNGADKVLAVLEGKARLWVSLGGGGFNPFRGMRGGGSSASDVDNIREALEIARMFGQGVVIEKPMSAWLIPDEIAATGSSVVWSPRTRVPRDPQDPERTGSNLAQAAILAKVGVPVAVTTPSGMFGGGGVGTGGILGQDLNTPHVDAAYAVRGGLDNRKALRTLTLDAANILGVGDRVGSLEAGKDADILILDGDPLHYSTFVTT